VIHRLPTGDVREEWSQISAGELQALVDTLRVRDFCGYVELHWPDCEGALILAGDGRVFAVFQADAVDLRGPEALRHLVARAERLRPRARVVGLPHALGPLLGALSELQPLHTGLHTAFVDLDKLAAKLSREGFCGMVVVEGEGWWGFLPFGEDGNGAVYYDGTTVMGRTREELVQGLVGAGAEVEVWVNPTGSVRPVEFEPSAPAAEPAALEEMAPEAPPASPSAEPAVAPEETEAASWQAYKDSDVFILTPALRVEDPQDPHAGELERQFGSLGLEVARRLDGTRTLEALRGELGRSPAELEPILLYLQQRKWMARYFSRRGPRR
jgi:hypothetical protein